MLRQCRRYTGEQHYKTQNYVTGNEKCFRTFIQYIGKPNRKEGAIFNFGNNKDDEDLQKELDKGWKAFNSGTAGSKT